MNPLSQSEKQPFWHCGQAKELASLTGSSSQRSVLAMTQKLKHLPGFINKVNKNVCYLHFL